MYSITTLITRDYITCPLHYSPTAACWYLCDGISHWLYNFLSLPLGAWTHPALVEGLQMCRIQHRAPRIQWWIIDVLYSQVAYALIGEINREAVHSNTGRTNCTRRTSARYHRSTKGAPWKRCHLSWVLKTQVAVSKSGQWWAQWPENSWWRQERLSNMFVQNVWHFQSHGTMNSNINNMQILE